MAHDGKAILLTAEMVADEELDYREVMSLNARWTDRLESQSGDWSGNIYDFFYRVFNKIAQNLRVPFRMEGIHRVDDTPVHQAIREALVNCFTNADFFVPRGIVIKMEGGALILENPGDIRVGKIQLMKGGQSDPRNKGIMKMFALLEIGERAGSGMGKILKTWSEEGYQEPTVEERFDKVERTIVRLPLNGDEAQKEAQKEAQNEAQKTLEDKIVELIRGNDKITKTEMAEKLGVSKSTIERTIRSSASIGHIGSSKGGRWVVKGNK